MLKIFNIFMVYNIDSSLLDKMLYLLQLNTLFSLREVMYKHTQKHKS